MKLRKRLGVLHDDLRDVVGTWQQFVHLQGQYEQFVRRSLSEITDRVHGLVEDVNEISHNVSPTTEGAEAEAIYRSATRTLWRAASFQQRHADDVVPCGAEAEQRVRRCPTREKTIARNPDCEVCKALSVLGEWRPSSP